MPTSPYSIEFFTTLDSRLRTADRLFYNRVPKCGSSATIHIIQRLLRFSQRKPFVFKHSRLFHTERFASKGAADLFVKALDRTNDSLPLMYERHLYFLDFRRHNRTNPMYVNLVRRPVDRFISEYYFRRFEHPKKMPGEVRNRTFDECVFGDYAECQTRNAFVIIPFFCGQHPLCVTPTRLALDRAKYNVDRYYGPIGLTEDLLMSYALFEQTLPRYFTNVTIAARRYLTHLKKRFKTHKKPVASEMAVQLMDSRLSLENEFYDFVKTRFSAFVKHYDSQIYLENILKSNATIDLQRKTIKRKQTKRLIKHVTTSNDIVRHQFRRKKKVIRST